MVSRAKMFFVATFVAALMMVVMAAPAFAFIHEFIPAGQCAASEQAGDNETAEDHLIDTVGVPVQQPPAPDVCPAPQK
jgi:hypothetical protein